MIKLIALLRKKAGMSREDFIAHYEMRHAPLAMQITAMGHDYRRNYTRSLRVEGKEVSTPPEYDVITEVWFQDQKAYEKFAASMQVPEIRAQIVADEEQFLDRSASRIFIVDEYITETPRLRSHRADDPKSN
jgi:uncharacterized protein (TIGR02118 family)